MLNVSKACLVTGSSLQFKFLNSACSEFDPFCLVVIDSMYFELSELVENAECVESEGETLYL